MADAAPPAAPAPVSVNDALELCTRVYGAAGDWARQRGQARWVMNLAWYRQVRAASETVTGSSTDPDTWTPDPSDMLFGIPVSVRDDGEEPHLEMVSDPSPVSSLDWYADVALAIARSILAPPPLDAIADGRLLAVAAAPGMDPDEWSPAADGAWVAWPDRTGAGLHDEVMTAGQLRALLATRDG